MSRKLGALLHKTHIQVLLVLRKQGSTCVDHIIITYNSTWNVAWSPIHPKKQDNRKNSGSGVWRWQGSAGGLDKIWKRGSRQHRGGLHKIGGLAPNCQLWKETFKHSPYPHSWLSPIYSKNSPLPLQPFLKNLIPTFMKEGGPTLRGYVKRLVAWNGLKKKNFTSSFVKLSYISIVFLWDTNKYCSTCKK